MPPDRAIAAARGENPGDAPRPSRGHHVEDHVPVPARLGEVGLPVVDDLVRAERRQPVEFAGVVDDRHDRPRRLRELQRHGPGAAPGPVDQKPRARTDALGSRDRDGARLRQAGRDLVRKGRRDRHHVLGRNAGILGESASGHDDVAHDPVARRDPVHAGTEPVDHADDIRAENRTPRPEDSAREAGVGRRPDEVFPIRQVHPAGQDAHPNLAPPGFGDRHLGHAQVFGSAVAVLENGLHPWWLAHVPTASPTHGGDRTPPGQWPAPCQAPPSASSSTSVRSTCLRIAASAVSGSPARIADRSSRCSAVVFLTAVELTLSVILR